MLNFSILDLCSNRDQDFSKNSNDLIFLSKGDEYNFEKSKFQVRAGLKPREMIKAC